MWFFERRGCRTCWIKIEKNEFFQLVTAENGQRGKRHQYKHYSHDNPMKASPNNAWSIPPYPLANRKGLGNIHVGRIAPPPQLSLTYLGPNKKFWNNCPLITITRWKHLPTMLDRFPLIRWPTEKALVEIGPLPPSRMAVYSMRNTLWGVEIRQELVQSSSRVVILNRLDVIYRGKRMPKSQDPNWKIAYCHPRADFSKGNPLWRVKSRQEHVQSSSKVVILNRLDVIYWGMGMPNMLDRNWKIAFWTHEPRSKVVADLEEIKVAKNISNEAVK